MTGRLRRWRIGVLGWIAAMLLASGVLRLGGHADMAFAIGSDEAEDLSDDTLCLPDGDTGALLDAFRSREARVVEREHVLAEREQAVSVAAAAVEERIAVLAQAEQSLAALIALADSAAEDDLARLTEVYENMKPRDAAALFETMDPAFAAGFLGMMQPESGAAILSELLPETAYSISVILAGRNAQAPTE